MGWKKYPLLDLVYGRYITILFPSSKEVVSGMPRRSTIFVKERNQWGKPDILTDIPEGGLTTLTPTHDRMPPNVYVLLAAGGGIAPVAEQLRIRAAQAYEKMAEALAQKDAAEASKKVQEKLMTKTLEQQVDDVTKATEKIQEAGSKFFSMPNRFDKDREDLLRR
jgi:hypothetical protein